MSPFTSRMLRVALVVILAAGVASCARLRVKSDPPGATVLWSPDGTSDWRPWPPKAWDTSAGRKEPQTPLTSYGRYSDAIWVTVEKDGYYRPRPQIAQLYTLRRQHLDFKLVETPETVAARRRAEGFVHFEGEWVRPEEHGLVEHEGTWMRAGEAFALEQRAKGLVLYEDEWITREEFEERFAADQRAKGLIPYKDRWVAPEVAEYEDAIDTAVAELAEQNLRALDLPKVLGGIAGSEARVQLFNTTSNPIQFLFSGPMSREFVLEPYDSYGVTPATRVFFPAGMYEVAVVPLESTGWEGIQTEGVGREVIEDTRAQFPAMFLETPLAAGFHYLFGYTGGADVSLEEGEEYRIQTPELPPDLPRIEIPDIPLPEPRRPQGRPNGPMAPGGRQMPPEGGQRPDAGQQRGGGTPQQRPAQP